MSQQSSSSPHGEYHHLDVFAMHRFFVPPAWIEGERATLEGDVAHQVGHVLRMSPGDEISLLDSSGKEYVVRLTRFNRSTVEGVVLYVDEAQVESKIELTLYQGLLKLEKFQWVLQKGTELGVTTFVPLLCQRSVPQERESWPRTRYPRWRKIITEAAEQSGRRTLPELKRPMSLVEACDELRGQGTSIMPWEKEKDTSLRSVLRGKESQRVNILIGPEGGFEELEVSHARSCGVIPVSLGTRILRSETAAVVAVAAAMYEVGELGG